jgi:hypothetical protein
VEESLRPEIKTRLRQVRSHIFSQLDRPWAVKDMAELAYLSPSGSTPSIEPLSAFLRWMT